MMNRIKIRNNNIFLLGPKKFLKVQKYVAYGETKKFNDLFKEKKYYITTFNIFNSNTPFKPYIEQNGDLILEREIKININSININIEVCNLVYSKFIKGKRKNSIYVRETNNILEIARICNHTEEFIKEISNHYKMNLDYNRIKKITIKRESFPISNFKEYEDSLNEIYNDNIRKISAESIIKDFFEQEFVLKDVSWLNELFPEYMLRFKQMIKEDINKIGKSFGGN